jgi:hypothetical protein
VKKIFVVAHDAGGAEIVGAYISKLRHNTTLAVYAHGPAAQIFRRLGIPFRPISDNRPVIARIVHTHRDADLALLAAPGWMTTIERVALAEAKKAGLHTAVYLEWWMDYRTIFKYPQEKWRENLPDEIWVGDSYAERLAVKYFGVRKTRFVPNLYFADIVARYRRVPKRMTSKGILFMSSSAAHESEEALTLVLDALSKKSSSKTLRIRFHPADKRNRYDTLLRRYKNVTVEKSSEKDIVQDLIGTDTVVGMNTVALAVSALCGLQTINIVPVGGSSHVPQKEVIQIRIAPQAPVRSISKIGVLCMNPLSFIL